VFDILINTLVILYLHFNHLAEKNFIHMVLKNICSDWEEVPATTVP